MASDNSGPEKIDQSRYLEVDNVSAYDAKSHFHKCSKE